MPIDNLTITNNIVVSMEYTLAINEGEEISRSTPQEPLVYIQGASQIIPGLEKELYGLKIGDKKEITIKPVDGYGEHLKEEVIEASKDNFPAEFEMEVGKGVSVTDRESGEQFIGYIKEILPESVVLDFNHPLAGKNLYFSVKILDLRHATDEEKAHGHVHEGDESH